MSCNLSISRERRMGYSARNVRIYLDGAVVSTLANGKTFSANITPGKHNIGFAIGNTIVTEISFHIEDGMDSVDIIFWVGTDGGIAVRLDDYNIPHTIFERETVGRIANKAVSATISVIATLFVIGMVCTFLFLLRFI